MHMPVGSLKRSRLSTNCDTAQRVRPALRSIRDIALEMLKPPPFVPLEEPSGCRYIRISSLLPIYIALRAESSIQLGILEVTSELWVDSLHGRVLLRLWLLDSISVGLLVLVVVRVVL